MAQPKTLDTIKNMAITAAARGIAKQAILEGRMKMAKIKQMLNDPKACKDPMEKKTWQNP
ncbi:MAG: hypothetical protein HQL94_02095 [Magnetococcales bacterium]|nr:hypothetical protein [Magnetococcales bacterium]MBF0439727.1 hypothetical protein [Magnetococcales bacterium]